MGIWGVTSTCSRPQPICGDLAVVLILERRRLSKHHNIDIFSERNIGITLECNETPFMIYGVDITQVLIERGHWFQMHIILYRSEDQTCKRRCSRFSESRKYRDKWFKGSYNQNDFTVESHESGLLKRTRSLPWTNHCLRFRGKQTCLAPRWVSLLLIKRSGRGL